MHQYLQGASFHVEHIIPASRHGTSDFENLAWACPGCNLKKSDRLDASDPETGEVVSLYHPRTQRWDKHFLWDEYQLKGVTAAGRATIAVLDLNHERRVRIRQAEQMFGLFPPES
jgi:Zn ribbon nucleic-acid-binding protein